MTEPEQSSKQELTVINVLEQCVDAQKARAEAEKKRAEAEKGRADAEKGRAEAEKGRAEAEKGRAEAEKGRAEAEKRRADLAERGRADFAEKLHNDAAIFSSSNGPSQNVNAFLRGVSRSKRPIERYEDSFHTNLPNKKSKKSDLKTKLDSMGSIDNLTLLDLIRNIPNVPQLNNELQIWMGSVPNGKRKQKEDLLFQRILQKGYTTEVDDTREETEVQTVIEEVD